MHANSPTERSLPAKYENVKSVKRPEQFRQCCMRVRKAFCENYTVLSNSVEKRASKMCKFGIIVLEINVFPDI